MRRIGRHGRIFCDLKLHDIPHQVGLAAAQISDLGVWMLSVHASGGSSMIRRAAENFGPSPVPMAGGARGAQSVHTQPAGGPAGPAPSILGAVTVLTSLSPGDLESVGQGADTPAQVLRLARVATRAGAGAIICSPHEVSVLRKFLGPDVVLVTPGVRPAGFAEGDQARVTTPGEAARAGANYVVVGRPITDAEDPAEATEQILHELRYARR